MKRIDSPRQDERLALHRVLWEQTLRNAARAPFYADLWKQFDFDELIAAGPEHLGDLPSVCKSDIRHAGEAARVPAATPRHHVLTGGTTGIPMRIMRSDEEIRFLHEFFTPEYTLGSRKRGLVFTAPYHGTQVPIRTNAHVHKINIYDAYSFDYAFDVLKAKHTDPQVDECCSFIAGQERVLNAFALFLQDRKVDPGMFELEFVCSQGSHVTPTVRGRIESTLNCTLIDRYSMSEIFGGASQQLLTGWYEPDPHVIFEVINPSTNAKLEAGIGELVATILFPFQQCQPMVRYRTGDLAEAPEGAHGATGLTHFRPLGRCSYSILSPECGGVILPASAVHDVLFDSPLLKRRPMFFDAKTSVSDSNRAGLPPFRLSGVNGGKTWELAIAPSDGNDRSAVETTIYHRLLKHPQSRLAEAIGAGLIAFTVRGTLDAAVD
jgi:phenylacetate-coenzyme A ligase PaaK-like adenylate-forming protein